MFEERARALVLMAENPQVMIASHRVFLKAPTYGDVAALLDLHQCSRDFHFPWAFPALTEAGCQDYIQRCQGDDYEGLLICRQEDGAIVGVANLSQIFYKAFQNAYLGYYADVRWAGQGLMTEGVGLVLHHAFEQLKLHRVEANIQPGNLASIKLVKRLGFIQEGFSRRYLYLNGDWRDHQRWALTVEDWHPARG